MDDQQQPLLGRRIGAFVIDWLIAGVIDSMIWIPWIMIPIIQNRIDAKEIVSRNFGVTLVAFLCLLLRDVVGGRSVGKRLLGLTVVARKESSMRPAVWQNVVRNLTLVVFPVEAIWLLASSGITRLGDKLAGTTVVRRKT